jgi:N-methylhydantoinase B
MNASSGADAIVLEIVKSALVDISEEMGAAVTNGAYSTSIKESGDASSAIFDAAGRLVAQGESTPLIHLCSMRPSLQAVIQDFPVETMREGDVYITNDPFRGGIHCNDILLLKPVFHEGKPAFFTGTLIHVADIGGMSAGGLPANATEIYHEGLVLRPMKFHDAGVPNATLLTVLTANSRTPDKLMGDLRALLGGVNVGEARLKSLIAKYGIERLGEIVGALLDYAERRTRQAISALKPGVYEGSCLIEGGVEDPPGGFTVRVKITIEGSAFGVDFTGTDGQARSSINAALSQTMSGVMFALRCLIDPTVPMNEGCYAPVKMVLPPGTLVNPNMPAAVNSRMATVGAITDAILEAMSVAYPEKAIAGSCNTNVITPTGIDKATGRTWAFISVVSGGAGARVGKDGIDCDGGPLMLAGFGFDTGMSSEALEMEYPVLVESTRMWRDSGGAGQWRGGVGRVLRLRVLEDCLLTARITDRAIIPPRGIQGGFAGVGGAWVVNAGTPAEVVLPTKLTNYPLKAGDVLTARGSGGGGVGCPLDRDPALVLKDVRQGKVGVDAAREQYGVAILAVPGDEASATIDDGETRRLRSAQQPAAAAP